MATVTRDAFRVYASGWGNIEELANWGLEWFSILVVHSAGAQIQRDDIGPHTNGDWLMMIVSCISQLFYAWRICMLSSNWWTTLSVIIVRANCFFL